MSENYSVQCELEDMEEYKRNAINVLRQNGQYATAKATANAFDIMIALYMIENKIPPKEVVRCSECKHSPNYKRAKGMVWCRKFREDVRSDGFCSNAERRTDDGKKVY